MKIKKILWATDGSEEADNALSNARYLAGLSGAEIIGAHVIPLPTVLLFESLSDDVEFKNWIRKVEDEFTEKFAKIKKQLSKSNIKFEGVLLRGKPSEKLREFARKRNADLIVMGKHGHGIIASLLLGSETARVVKATDKPVLITKDKKGRKKISYSKILVPFDLSHKCHTALHAAMDIANAGGGHITVIYALRLDMYAQDVPAGALNIVIKQSISELANEVDRMVQKYKGAKDIKIKTEVVHGLSVASTISTYAEEKGTNLIVIHTHGRTGINRLIMGSVTDKVVNNATCSVLALNP
jgi:nucleotide-binding universal stress UspA family protein